MAIADQECLDPRTVKYIYRKKGKGFKTQKFNKAMRHYNRCVSGAMSSTSDVIGEIGDGVSDLAEAIAMGGEREAYVPPYSEGSGTAQDSGDTTAWAGMFTQKVGGIPIWILIGGGLLLLRR